MTDSHDDYRALQIEQLEEERESRLKLAGPMAGSVREYFKNEIMSTLRNGEKIELPDLGDSWTEGYDKMLPFNAPKPREFDYPFMTVNQAREAFGYPPLKIIEEPELSNSSTLVHP